MISRFSLRLAAVLAVVAAIPAAAAVWVVAPDGTGDVPTIQAAVDAAENWDVIELLDGVFTGPGNRDIIHPVKFLTIRSQSGDPSACIIDIDAGPGDAHFGLKYGDGG